MFLNVEPLETRRLFAAGELDPSFGDGGILVTNFAGSDRAFGVGIQNDGGIIAAGTSLFVARRFTPTGSLDPSFAIPAGFGSDLSNVYSAAVQSDDKVLLLASDYSGGGFGVGVLCRLNADGSPDESFSSDGRIELGLSVSTSKLLIDSANRIYVSSFTFTTGLNAYVARITPNGEFDAGFGVNGVRTVPGLNAVYSAALSAGGDVYISGVASPGASLARISANGDLLSITSLPRAQLPPSIHSRVGSMLVDPNARVVAAGATQQQASILEMWRTLADGSRDLSFGDQGYVGTTLGQAEIAINRVLRQQDGKLVVIGRSRATSTGDWQFLVARFNDDGSVDTSFANGGVMNFGLPDSTDSGLDYAIAADGRLVISGYSQPAGVSSVFLRWAFAKVDIGNADTFAPTASQRRSSFTVATSQRLTIGFSEALDPQSISSGDLIATRLEDGAVFSAVSTSTAQFATTATWDFGNTLPDGNFSFALPAGAVSDLVGNVTSVDSAHAGPSFFVLAGDATRDRSVDIHDFAVLASNFGQPGRTFTQGDFNYSGNVDITDFAVLAGNFGASVAAGRVAPPATAVTLTLHRSSTFDAPALRPDRLNLFSESAIQRHDDVL